MSKDIYKPCLECGRVTARMGKHITHWHTELTQESYCIKHFYEGIRPKCGNIECDKKVKFVDMWTMFASTCSLSCRSLVHWKDTNFREIISTAATKNAIIRNNDHLDKFGNCGYGNRSLHLSSKSDAFYCMSDLEKDCCELLDRLPNVIKYEKVLKPGIPYLDPYRGERTYFPDFKISYEGGSVKVVEVKYHSDFSCLTNQSKWKAALENYISKNITFEVWNEHYIRNNESLQSWILN